MRIAALAFSLLCVAGVSAAMAASTEADFKAALAAAQAAEQDAGKLKNQWIDHGAGFGSGKESRSRRQFRLPP